MGNLGIIYYLTGQYELSIEHYRQAIDIAREIRAKRSEEIQLGNLGDVLLKVGRLQEAEEALLEAIEIGDDVFQVAGGAFRGSLGLLKAQKGQMDEAKALFQNGEHQVASNPEEHVKFLCKKGQVYHMAGDIGEARAASKQAQELAAKLNMNVHSVGAQALVRLRSLLETSPQLEWSDEQRELALLEAERLLELGNIERAQSRLTDALDCYQSAHKIFQGLSNRSGEGRALGHLGTIHWDLGRFDQAIHHYERALTIAQEVDDARSAAKHRGNLGAAYNTKGQHEVAIGHYTQALTLSQEMRDKMGEAIHLGNLGAVYLAKGQYDRAIESLNESLSLAKEIGDKSGEELYLGNLGNAFRAKGQIQDAVRHYRKAVALSNEIGDRRSKSIHLGNLGDALVMLSQFEEAEAAFREAIPVCDETVATAAGAFRGSLALLLAQQGQLDEARILVEQGEQQVKSQPEEYVKFLCKKVQVCRFVGDLGGLKPYSRQNRPWKRFSFHLAARRVRRSQQ